MRQNGVLVKYEKYYTIYFYLLGPAVNQYQPRIGF